jgi:hypothetical protein
MSHPILNATFAADRLAAQAQVIAALVAGVDEAAAHWRPAPDAWNIVEVLNHLCDEEREDFRTRLDLALHRPEADWPPIDPQGWVTARTYDARPLADSLRDFLAERKRSVQWLRGLDELNLASEHRHPIFGSMAAGEMLAAWLAHDCLHIRQLNEICYAWLAAMAAPYTVAYAGDW